MCAAAARGTIDGSRHAFSANDKRIGSWRKESARGCRSLRSGFPNPGCVSRRRVVRLVSGLAVVGPITSLALPIAEAKRKKNKRKKKKNQTCTPDPLAATCFHRCGTVTNNCGQATSCPGCSGGRQCLINGTCAMVCSTSADCTAACGCTGSVDGTVECVVSGGSCADFPQTCSTTADCPAGQHCEQTGCGPGPSFENRCVGLC